MTNPILAALAPVLTAPINDLQTRLTAIVQTPTIENVTSQFEGLTMDAISPSALENVSIAGVAQEALNLISMVESHLSSAIASPSSVLATMADPVTPSTIAVPAPASDSPPAV